MSGLVRRDNTVTKERTTVEASTVAATAATGSIMLATAQRDYVVDTFEIAIPGGYTADDTNYYAITLQAGATVLATAALKITGGTGNLADLTFVSGALAAVHSGALGDQLKAVLTKNGSAVNLAAGTRLVAHIRYL